MKTYPINGWTKQGIIDHIKANFKGKAMQTRSLMSEQAMINTPHLCINNTSEMCRYKTDDGKRCAVGMFIPPASYSPAMEDKNSILLMSEFPEIGSIMPLDKVSMASLQFVHDRSRPETTLTDLLNWIDINVIEPEVTP